MFNAIVIPVLIFIVAVLYSSVGHGGASGYLAVLSMFHIPPDQMATTALILNLVVAGLALANYARAGYFSWRLTLPFMIGSIPAAYLGGAIAIQEGVYRLILGLVLLYSAWRILSLKGFSSEPERIRSRYFWLIAIGCGVLIGLVSGMIGVGGGIFLSPLMLLMGWADLKQTAATSAMFIVVNATSGLLGRLSRHAIHVGTLWPLLLAGFIGGLVGSVLGAHRVSGNGLRLLLAVVLILAGSKLVFTVLSGWIALKGG